MHEFKITFLGSLGYGNPDASIGFDKIIERKNIPKEIVDFGRELLTGGECMVDVNRKDDGCMDGRSSAEIVYPSEVSDTGFEQVKVDSVAKVLNHNRYKLAGGGYITAFAMQLALEPEVTELSTDLERAVNRLSEEDVYCGIHTADCNGDEASTGCGASDKIQKILRRALSLKDEVNSTIESVFDQLKMPFDPDAAKRADDGLEVTLGHRDYFENSNGKSRFEVIMRKIAELNKSKNNGDRPLAVCKGLKGEHKELYAIINTAEGKTFSQAKFTMKIQDKIRELYLGITDEQVSDITPEVFSIDVPRVVQLAKIMAKGRPNEEEAYQTALYAGLSFQFATAAELTDGTLENYLVEAA